MHKKNKSGGLGYQCRRVGIAEMKLRSPYFPAFRYGNTELTAVFSTQKPDIPDRRYFLNWNADRNTVIDRFYELLDDVPGLEVDSNSRMNICCEVVRLYSELG